jgi:hypothetical protein
MALAVALLAYDCSIVRDVELVGDAPRRQLHQLGKQRMRPA